MNLPTPGCRQITHHLFDHAEQWLDLLTMAARQVVRRQHPQRDDRDPNLVAPPDELLEFVCAGLVSRNEWLLGSVRTCPTAVSVGEYRDVAWQPLGVELGDQPMLISRVQQSRRMQTIHELAQPIETCHNW